MWVAQQSLLLSLRHKAPSVSVHSRLARQLWNCRVFDAGRQGALERNPRPRWMQKSACLCVCIGATKQGLSLNLGKDAKAGTP